MDLLGTKGGPGLIIRRKGEILKKDGRGMQNGLDSFEQRELDKQRKI